MNKNNNNSIIHGHTYIVNPNLGHPIILDIKSELKKNRYQTSLLFATDMVEPVEFEKHIKNKITFVPILEERWKLKSLLSKLKVDKKEKKSFKKKIKRSKHAEKSLFRELKPLAFRGAHISTKILQIDKAEIRQINDPNFDEYLSPQKYLNTHHVYRYSDIFYKVTIEFELTKEILKFLKHRNFIMFDIIDETHEEPRINYHALVISKQKWKNFSFVQATDLHVARRNDKIYEIIKKWKKVFRGDYLDALLKDQEQEGKQEKKKLFRPLEAHKPLKKRFINPNNQFRRFIKMINKKVLKNEIDFIALTGDLIDFSILSKIPKELRLFDYDHSNWKVFKNIVLNLPQKKRKGMKGGEELLCPIFTIPGNHDYRPFHYDIRWAGMYRKMGLKAFEALALNDKLVALPISAIIKSEKSLIGYWSEINPSLDYFLKLGKSNFIFLNTGSDSFKNISDFLTGHPSLTGLKNKQISYLENLISNKIQQGDNTFLFLHGPVINPKKKIGLFKRIKQKFGKKILTRIDEFKESMLKKLGKQISNIRIDKKFNVKYGTVSSNWEKLVEFCKDHCVLTMTGHTHTLKEFRLGNPENKKSLVLDAPPFSLKKIVNPAAIFYDTYSEIFTNAKDIKQFGPFVVQTPALGLGGYRSPRLVGAYREIKVKHGKLSSFKVNYMHREYYKIL
ncbi:MAG: hypothetical protein EU529_16985 [Promethearchaeota archaeon]|nr:MAG: hypothetical protein EU529_16985 [Candidatus Lokiarchaeota archaeon]